jgi:hypothetical protein
MIRSLIGRPSKKGHNACVSSARNSPWERSREIPLGGRTHALLAPSDEKAKDEGRVCCLHPRGPNHVGMLIHLLSVLKTLILQPALSQRQLLALARAGSGWQCH